MGPSRSHVTPLLAVALLLVALAVLSGPVAAGDAPSIDPGLDDANGTVAVMVMFGGPADPVDSVDSLEAHANQTQWPFVAFAVRTPGVTVDRQFWIANAALVSVDTDGVALTRLAQVSHVTGIHENAPIESDGARTSASGAVAADGTEAMGTIGVPTVWQREDTRGAGVTVAVLDTGADAGHPDIELAGWRDFGNASAETPHDYGWHGTHVSGSLAGGNASGTTIGVAPDADLLHGAVLTDCDAAECQGSFDRIIAGMEWAIANDAEIISMSLGSDAYEPVYIAAVRNAEAAGILVVAASGNDGPGRTLSPGNLYGTLSVGATRGDGRIASFSGGADVATAEAWGEAAVGGWPETYTVPDVVAPGVGVTSADAGGGYRTARGTSMATPQVAGIAALMEASTARDLSPSELRAGLRRTARLPPGTDADRRSRFGHGIVHAPDAVAFVTNSSTVTGTVTDARTGSPLANATVTVTGPAHGTAVTNDNGAFTIGSLRGNLTYNVSVEAPGYEPTHTTITPTPDTVATLEIPVAGAGALSVEVTSERFGGPIPLANVTITGADGTYHANQTESGTYVARAIPDGRTYAVRVRADGYEPVGHELHLTGNATAAITMQGSATLAVDVRDAATGAVISDATITLTDMQGRSDTVTTANGSLERAIPGTGSLVAVDVKAERYRETTEVRSPEHGGRTAIVAELVGDATVTVAVTDDHRGTPLEGGSVELRGDRGTYANTTNGEGLARLSVPGGDMYALVVDRIGYALERETVSPRSGQHLDRGVSLRGSATLALEVFDPDGAPVSGATVRVVPEDGDAFEPAARTDSDGNLVVAVPGHAVVYELRVTHVGYPTRVATTTRMAPGRSESVSVTLPSEPRPLPTLGPVGAILACLLAVLARRG